MRIRYYFVLFVLFLIGFGVSATPTSYTWNGTSSTWNLASNWTPNTGYPVAGDIVTIVSKSAAPILSSDLSLGGFYISSGTIDLSTYTLTVTGASTCSGGTVSNGSFVVNAGTASTAAFSGVTFNAGANVTSGNITIVGSGFYSSATFEKTGTNYASMGNNHFYGALSFKNSSPNPIFFSNNGSDTFDGVVTFINTSSGAFHFGYAFTSVFNNNLILNNTGSAAIFCAAYVGSATLKYDKSITSSGMVSLNKFNQLASNGGTLNDLNSPSAHSFVYSGTWTTTTNPPTPPIIFTNGTLGGAVNIDSPGLTITGSSIWGNTSINKTGTFADNWSGNQFKGTTSIAQNSTGTINSGTATSADLYGLTLSIISNTTSGTCNYAFQNNLFGADITLQNTSNAGICNIDFTGKSTSQSKLKGIISTVNDPDNNPFLGNITFGNMTQGALNVASSILLKLAGASKINFGTGSNFYASLTVKAADISIVGSQFFSGAAFEKTGNANPSTQIGKNHFYGTLSFINSGSNSIYFTNNGQDIFDGVTTFTNVSSGTFHFGYAATSIFNNNLILINTGGGTIGCGIYVGSATLKYGQTITNGTAASGTINLKNFIQLASDGGTTNYGLNTSITHDLSGSTTVSNIIILTNVVLNGNLNIATVGDLTLTGTAIKGNFTLNKTSTTTNTWTSNVISGNCAITTASTGGISSTGVITTDHTKYAFGGNLTVTNQAATIVPFTLNTSQVGGNFTGTNGYYSFTGNTFYGTTAITSSSQTSNFTGNTYTNLLTVNSTVGAIFHFGVTTREIYSDILINNSSANDLIFAMNSPGNQFNGNITLSNTGVANIRFGYTAPCSSALIAGKLITLGTFSSGTLAFLNFTQSGSDSESFMFSGTGSAYFNGSNFNGPLNIACPSGTGSGTISVGPGNTFAGNFTATSPTITLGGSALVTTFGANATLSIIPGVGSVNFQWVGSFDFNGDAYIGNNSSTASILLSQTSGSLFRFFGNVKFDRTSTGNILAANMGPVEFYKDLTYNYPGGTPGGVGSDDATQNFGYNGGAGVCYFKGPNPQKIKSDNINQKLSFGSIVIDKSGGEVTLLTNVYMLKGYYSIFYYPVLTLTNGIIISSANAVLSMGRLGTVTGTKITSYVSGPFNKMGADAFTFPIGKYDPVTGISLLRTISMTAPNNGSVGITAEYMPSAPGGITFTAPLLDVSECEYWNMTSNYVAPGMGLSLNWEPTYTCTPINKNVMSVARYMGTNIWQNEGNTFGGTNDYDNGTVSSGTMIGWTVNTQMKVALGYRSRLEINTALVNPTQFTVNYVPYVVGSQTGLVIEKFKNPQTYTSGSAGSNGGIVKVHPDQTATCVPISIAASTNVNSAYDICVLMNTNNNGLPVSAKSSVDGRITYYDMSEENYDIPSGGAVINFKHKTADPVYTEFTSTLSSGVVYDRTQGQPLTFALPGFNNSALSLQICDLNGNPIAGPFSPASWSVSAASTYATGTYKFKLTAGSQVFAGQFILK